MRTDAVAESVERTALLGTPVNAPDPMLATVLEMARAVNPVHPENADEPMLVKPNGIEMDVMAVLFRKALASMDVIAMKTLFTVRLESGEAAPLGDTDEEIRATVLPPPGIVYTMFESYITLTMDG